MADILKPEEFADLWERIEASRKTFTKKPDGGGPTRETRIKMDRCLYAGDHYNPVLYGGEEPNDGFIQVAVPKIGSNIRIIIANLMGDDDQFDIEPRYDYAQDADGHWVEMDAATKRKLPIIHAKRLEQYWQSSGAEEGIYHALLDALGGGGIGINLTLWNEGEADPLAGIAPDDYDQAAQMAQWLGVMGKAVRPPVEPDGTGPVTIRIPPSDLVIDPNATADDIQGAEFIGRRFSVPLEDLKRADPRFEKILDGMTGRQAPDEITPTETAESRREYDPVERVWLYEVYFKREWVDRSFTIRDTDPKTGEERVRPCKPGYYPLLVTWAQDRPREPLRCEVWPVDLRDNRGRRRYPYRAFVPYPMTDRLEGQSQAELEEWQQKELNKSRSSLATIARRSANVKGVYQQGALTPEGADAMESDEPGQWIEHNAGFDIGQTRWLQTPPIAPEILEQGESASRDQDIVSGVDEASQGVAAQGGQTATEANLLASKSGARIGLLRRLYRNHVQGIAQDQYDLLIQFNLIGDSIQVSVPRSQGGTGEIEAVQIGPEHLVPATVKLTSGAAMAQDKQSQIQNLQVAIQLTASIGALGSVQNPMGTVNSQDLVEQLLILLGVDKGQSSLYDTSEFQQQAQQMQMQQMMMQQQAQGQAMAAADPAPQAPSQASSAPEAQEPDPDSDPAGFYASLSPDERDQVHQMVLQGLQGNGGNGNGAQP